MSVLLEKELLAKELDEATEAQTESAMLFADYKQKSASKMAELDKTFAELRTEMDEDGIDFIDIKSPGEPLPPRGSKGSKEAAE